MAVNLTFITQQTRAAAEELLTIAQLKEGEILVVGCSTSEIGGVRIGAGGSTATGRAVLEALREVCAARGVRLAVQCCEHLNRALVVERETARLYGLEEVAVVPIPHAGGALAAEAYRTFRDAVAVETIAAHAGLDIGCTLIGMHLKRVAAPVRLSVKRIGEAPVAAARTRPKLIGGRRAVYELPAEDKPAGGAI